MKYLIDLVGDGSVYKAEVELSMASEPDTYFVIAKDSTEVVPVLKSLNKLGIQEERRIISLNISTMDLTRNIPVIGELESKLDTSAIGGKPRILGNSLRGYEGRTDHLANLYQIKVNLFYTGDSKVKINNYCVFTDRVEGAISALRETKKLDRTHGSAEFHLVEVCAKVMAKPLRVFISPTLLKE